MEAAIRFSQNSPSGSHEQRFLHVDVAGRSFKLCQITEISRRKVSYDVVCASTKVPTFRAFDWHPVTENLIAVGQSGGEATLLNIADGYHDSISFSVRSQRLCNAVALSANNLIAVGLDKVRTDFCLNIWDLNQRLPTGSSRSFTKNHTDPLHKLAGGEPITSIKFFSTEPNLLVAGVKGQFMRLYDLREPNSSHGLQFPTRCVHNVAVDNVNDNYFASCFPSTDPLVCVWDRRMISRTNNSPISFSGFAQSDSKQAEASLELRNAVEPPGMIWGLRFSKTHKRCVGVLSNTGQLKAFKFETSDIAMTANIQNDQIVKRNWQESEPEDVFLDEVQSIEQYYPNLSSTQDPKKRIVSFDFTTSETALGDPKLVVLTGEGDIHMVEVSPPPEPTSLSTTGFLCRGSAFIPAPTVDANDSVAKILDKVRRAAEPRNALRLAFKQSKQHKSSGTGQQTDLRRMSSFANQCWNNDLGFFEKGVSVVDLVQLIAASRLRCEAGYLLNSTKNKTIVGDSQWLESYWSWIERAERISRNGNMTQDNMDLSYVGVYGIWMEEIATKPRLVGGCSVPMSNIIKNLVNRLNMPVRRLCSTEYRAHRQLCLHIIGLAWGHEDLEITVKKLASGNQHTKAAAMAVFASDETMAYKTLRSRTSTQTHKMLAMALAGSKQRRKSANTSATEESGTEGDDDWTETISSLSGDLTDPYARAILAYVKSGDWLDVLEIDALPLKHRIGIALRHLDDNDLTAYIGRITRHVIETGDLEGILLTGTGTTEGLGLMSSYARTFNDLQTAILGLSIGGAAERFVSSSSDRDTKAKRTIEAFRETYRSQIMHWGLKFDRVRFDVGSSKALTQYSQQKLPRPKEQVRLVCTFCSGSLTQFPTNGSPDSTVSTPGISQSQSSMRVTDTAKHPLTSEKAAVTGTVCPKCGRHLPRCGVCDLWLGAPDESYSKWYTTQQQRPDQTNAASNSASDRNKRGGSDLAGSMSGSVVTTIGPPNSTSAKMKPSSRSDDREAADRNGDFDEIKRVEERRRTAMQKFTVFCVTCGHGFHAVHASLWFKGRDGKDGHKVCPVPGCECRCNG